MSILGGRYTLEVPLGESDLGTVWAAHDSAGAKLVVVTLEDDADEEVAVRFREHANALVALEHANVARALATGDSESGTPYLVLERIEGASLAKRLTDGPALTVARVIEIAVAVADALAAVHAAKIAHGDIEPGNILLADRSGKDVAKLISFGLNRASGRGSLARTSLPSIDVMAFAAPEQARGEVVASSLADQASLAAVVYAALAGRPPHVAADLAALAASIAEGSAPTITAVKRELAPFASTLSRALSSDPSKRFADVAAFARALKTAATMARSIAQVTVPLGPRSAIGEPIREAKGVVPRPGAGLAGRAMPSPKHVVAKPVPKPTDTKVAPAAELISSPAAAKPERVTEELDRLSEVLIEEPPKPARGVDAAPPPLPPTEAAPASAAVPAPSPPAVPAEIATLDDADLVERNSDGGAPPRPMPPPAPPPPPHQADEDAIAHSPSLENIAVAAVLPKPPPPSPKPRSERSAETAAPTASIQPVDALASPRPAWLVPAIGLAAVLVVGIVAWRVLSPADSQGPTQRTPVVELTAAPETAETSPVSPTEIAVVPEPPAVEPPALVPPPRAPIVEPPTTRPISTPTTTPHTTTPHTTTPHTTTPHTTTPHTTTPRTAETPRTRPVPPPPATPPRRPTVVSDPGF